MSNTAWDAVLERYAKLKEPDKHLAPSVLLMHDDKCLTIFDGYEKAKFHFLVLPRDPFILSSGAKIPSQNLASLSLLLRSPSCLQVLRAMSQQANKVVTMIQDEMQKRFGCVWDVQVGFHAVESMRHVHLHVISADLCSARLKNKKHFNSFHPKLGFFLHLKDIVRMVESGKRELRPRSEYEAILKQPLVSHITNQEFSTIPKLKQHLQESFDHMVNSGRPIVAPKHHNRPDASTTSKKREYLTEESSSSPRSKKVKPDVIELSD
ncbi:aprataxin-like protein [Microbotryomycetes sp. JL201]|nr:aprataxin-like protein [Microbotryomycetes sp. JL201]